MNYFNLLLLLCISDNLKTFIHETSLDKIVQKMNKEQLVHPLTLAFFLKLVSCVSYEASDSNMKESMLYLYQRVISENCTNPCVLNAWLQGLDVMLHNCNFVKDWILAGVFITCDSNYYIHPVIVI